MPRLVDANEILKFDHQHYDYMSDEFYVLVRDIENAPTVDAVEVVRCKDCEYYNGEYKYCVNDIFAKPNGYCSYGKRKEDADFEEPEINPCRGCEDYDGKGGCLSKGGCGERREDAK
jgi:hypothetical protein